MDLDEEIAFSVLWPEEESQPDRQGQTESTHPPVSDEMLARSLQQAEHELEREELTRARAALAEDLRMGRRGLGEPRQAVYPGLPTERNHDDSQPDRLIAVPTEASQEGEAEHHTEFDADQCQRQQDIAAQTCDTVPEGDAGSSDQLFQQMTGSGQDQMNLPAIPEEGA